MTPRTYSFGYWLRRRRKALDLTQRALAQAVSCSEDAIRKIEADERRPSRRLAERIAERLAIAPEERAAFLDAARAARAARSAGQLVVDDDPIEPSTAFETSVAPVPDSTESVPSTGHSLERLPGGLFVGRHKEVAALKAVFDEVAVGHGRLAMLAGEPGIGKTRTSNELATYAATRGALVLWGRCYEGGGAPSYWPWVQAIRAHVRD